MKETEIINEAMENFQQYANVFWKWSPIPNNLFDGNLTLKINNKNFILNTEIKKDLKNHQIDNILKKNKEVENFLLVAERLYPKVRDQLRKNEINYIEANGNVFLQNNDIFIFNNINKTKPEKKETGNRAFTKTGLKVMFHMLLDTTLINKTQREIAKITNVALGNIPQIINGLYDTGLIIKLNKNEYAIENYLEFLNKWAIEYHQTLKPNLLKKRYRFPKNIQWQELKFKDNNTIWGGEPAADILTNYLRPEKFLLYTTETVKEIMLKYKLIPNDEGEIYVYDIFWEHTVIGNNLVPKPLIYADLIMTNDKRCIETAKMIYCEQIEPNL